jgi:DNA-binding winged helix-turn-helix (wHTH) protein/Tol biopolymer transport system component
MPTIRPDLPQATRLRVGECVVDIPLREIVRAGGTGVRVTAKSMAVLLMLARQPGQVVARDTLLDSVWAGTLPTDDVLTQAITGLRKAFGDDRDAPAYLETIPKSGYRLLAEVEWLPDAPPEHLAKHRWRGRVAWVLGVVAVVALGWWIGAGRFHAVAPPPATPAVPASDGELAYTLLTSRVGPETQPALSPDGAMVAYAMPPGAIDDPAAIFIQAAHPVAPRQLTTPPPGSSDHLPRWSPDGMQLMFARIDENGGCEFQLLPVSGGAGRAIGRCDRVNGRYDWLPDGSGVVAGLKPEAEGRPGALSNLRLETGQWEPMRYAIGPADVDFDPRFSPDGTRIGFRRNLSRSDVWEMPAGGGEPQRLTRLRGSISGWDWAPDGKSLLLGTLGSPPRLYRHDLGTGLTRALGRFPAVGLDLAARRNTMVFTVDDARIAMFRYRLPLGSGTIAEPLFASTGTDLLPSPSPDGKWIAFHSDRSREARLWLGDPDDPGHLRVVDGIAPISRHPPQWSPDSRSILVVGEVTDAEGVPRQLLYQVDVASGRSTEVAVDDGVPYFAQHLPGQRLLLVVDGGAGRLSLRIVDAAAPPLRTLARMDDVGEARFDPVSGEVFLVRGSSPGLWRVGLDLRTPELVAADQPAGYWLRRWGTLDGRPFALRTAAPGCLAQWHWMGVEPAPAAGCLDPERRGEPSLAVMVSQDRAWLYASMVVGLENSDIGLLELDPPQSESSATP